MSRLQNAEKAGNLVIWTKRISEQEIPVLTTSVDAIKRIATQADASASELASIILQDACLTASVLKLANSTLYNPSRIPINTVTRSVIVLGFEVVKNLSLSLTVVEALLKPPVKDLLVGLMARSFHAAVQANAMAERRGDTAPEELFTAALLYHLGEMAFWCVAEREAEQILELMKIDRKSVV